MDSKSFDIKDVEDIKRLSNLALTENVKAYLLKVANSINIPKPVKVVEPLKQSIVTDMPCKVIKDYAFSQSSSAVTLYLTIPTPFNQEDLETEITETGLYLLVKSNDIYYKLHIKELFGKIESEKFVLKVKGNNIVLTLPKKKMINWDGISAVDRKKEKSTDIDEKDETGDPMMNMIKKMYDEGDDNIKRVIAEAWTKNSQKKISGMDPVDSLSSI